MLADRLAADVLAWVTGWSRAREAPARLLGDHAVVDLTSTTRDREYIVVSPSAAVGRARARRGAHLYEHLTNDRSALTIKEILN